MSMINAKIRTSTYITEKELIKDFELMFNNARHYNEENSQVRIRFGQLLADDETDVKGFAKARKSFSISKDSKGYRIKSHCNS